MQIVRNQTPKSPKHRNTNKFKRCSPPTSLKVAHYDCSLMDSNKMYSLNKVAPCKIEPQNVEISKVKGQIFNRFFRGKLEATMCRASHQSIR